MSSAEISEHPPIYDGLVQELGDVLAETRQVAEQTRDQVRQALDWSTVRDAQEEREQRAFSAFG
ncbi:hypothetical protein C8250_042450 [Streptomyces sp. So13.3]|uniref:hypothetical protein n=1 Tax=Streptomyces TaxID=1883 RepID=UPI0011074CDF|nr:MULTISPECIES: hypothetical protein [Streptomyces]MCZ4102564.1 hypothetical protein [Streptomyces sp. H39-C1]QNA77558.1 hypothetical protein C8250_042450 [Streptomyces sp. So13.3]